MNKVKWSIGTILLGVILNFGFTGLALQADSLFEKNEHHENERDDERHENKKGEHKNRSKSAGPINKLYVEECGACHVAYPAGLLPKQSWYKIMTNLENHFDENAELDAKTGQQISNYLNKYALDSGLSGRLRKMLRNIPKQAPIRITKLPYFIRKHDEIPSRMVKGNPKVGSFSQCDKCHQGAQRGDFEEDRVKIPGFGRWED